jgi:hypothetical protein
MNLRLDKLSSNNMSLFRISLGVSKKKDSQLDDYATNIVIKTTANAATFPGQTANVAAVGAAQVNFHESLSVSKGNGLAATADKKAKRVILEAALRVLALAIQAIPGMTAATARLSGFDVIESGPHAPVATNKPVIGGLSNVAPGKLGVKVTAPDGYKSLEFQTTVGTAEPVRCGTFPSTRDVVLEDLPSLQLHAVQCRAVFGGKRYSEWSEPVSHTTT